jgi:hypothetical protein
LQNQRWIRAKEFGRRIENVASLVKDFLPNQSPRRHSDGKGDCFLASSMACQQRRRASLTYRLVLPTLCFTKNMVAPWLPAATLGPRSVTGLSVACGRAKGARKRREAPISK